MKKLLVTAGLAGVALAAWKLVQGWKDNTPSARELKEPAKEATQAVKGTTIGNPANAMG